MVAEDSSSGGRADLVVRGDEGVHIFEFKLLPDAQQPRGEALSCEGQAPRAPPLRALSCEGQAPRAPPLRALAQIKARGYADKYRQPGRPIHLIGVEFSREARNIAAFEVERAA